jgi:FkbM family methyltransferase
VVVESILPVQAGKPKLTALEKGVDSGWPLISEGFDQGGGNCLVPMFESLQHSAMERARCAKHNWLDPVTFRMRYSRGIYHVRTEDGMEFCFPFNPYLSFFEIGGYLRHDKWRPEPGMVVVDAGGGRGEFALYVSRLVGPDGRVFMLEPDPESRAMAEKAFGANGGKPDNLTVVPEGLWKEPGTLTFAAGLGESSVLVETGSEMAKQARAQGAELVSIQVHSLPSLVEALKMSRLDLVKMDIEGAEVEAIEGAGPTLARMKPKFTIAAYHQREGRQSCQLLEPLFRSYGYHVQTGFPAHVTTYASAEPISNAK